MHTSISIGEGACSTVWVRSGVAEVEAPSADCPSFSICFNRRREQLLNGTFIMKHQLGLLSICGHNTLLVSTQRIYTEQGHDIKMRISIVVREWAGSMVWVPSEVVEVEAPLDVCVGLSFSFNQRRVQLNDTFKGKHNLCHFRLPSMDMIHFLNLETKLWSYQSSPQLQLQLPSEKKLVLRR